MAFPPSGAGDAKIESTLEGRSETSNRRGSGAGGGYFFLGGAGVPAVGKGLVELVPGDLVEVIDVGGDVLGG